MIRQLEPKKCGKCGSRSYNYEYSNKDNKLVYYTIEYIVCDNCKHRAISNSWSIKTNSDIPDTIWVDAIYEKVTKPEIF